jgi:hypothetical protein
MPQYSAGLAANNWHIKGLSFGKTRHVFSTPLETKPARLVRIGLIIIGRSPKWSSDDISSAFEVHISTRAHCSCIPGGILRAEDYPHPVGELYPVFFCNPFLHGGPIYRGDVADL